MLSARKSASRGWILEASPARKTIVGDLKSEVQHRKIEAQMSKRTYQQLSESERQAIALGLQQKQTISAIARALGRHKSTISREIERNAGGNGYISRFAQQRRDKRRIHSRP